MSHPLAGPNMEGASGVNSQFVRDGSDSEMSRSRVGAEQHATRWKPSEEQKKFLLDEFHRNPYPNMTTKAQLATTLRVKRAQVSKWFQHKRESLSKLGRFHGQKQRERRTKEQLQILEEALDQHAYPNAEQITAVIERLNGSLSPAQVKLWFKHKRNILARKGELELKSHRQANRKFTGDEIAAIRGALAVMPELDAAALERLARHLGVNKNVIKAWLDRNQTNKDSADHDQGEPSQPASEQVTPQFVADSARNHSNGAAGFNEQSPILSDAVEARMHRFHVEGARSGKVQDRADLDFAEPMQKQPRLGEQQPQPSQQQQEPSQQPQRQHFAPQMRGVDGNFRWYGKGSGENNLQPQALRPVGSKEDTRPTASRQILHPGHSAADEAASRRPSWNLPNANFDDKMDDDKDTKGLQPLAQLFSLQNANDDHHKDLGNDQDAGQPAVLRRRAFDAVDPNSGRSPGKFGAPEVRRDGLRNMSRLGPIGLINSSMAAGPGPRGQQQPGGHFSHGGYSAMPELGGDTGDVMNDTIVPEQLASVGELGHATAESRWINPLDGGENANNAAYPTIGWI